MFEKGEFVTSFRNKLLRLTLVVFLVTVTMPVIVRPLSILIFGIGVPATLIVGIGFLARAIPVLVVV